jgi:hypothetical protein
MACDEGENHVTMGPNGVGQTNGWANLAAEKVIEGKGDKYDFMLRLRY